MKCSIICNTYNHEHVIHRAIDGFMMQKVNFEIEVLIHDDASTDRTQEIIRQYEKKYPNLIKPIFQKENQTCQGHSVTQINIERAQGEYIAICEGDDYWTHPDKLQKQIDFLDNNPDFSCVGHASYIKNINNPFKTKIWSFKKENSKLHIEEIIRNRGIVFPYNSIVFRTNMEKYPSFFDEFKVADVKRILFSAIKGNVFYFNQAMSVYQVGIRNSWTERVRLNRQNIVEHYLKEIDFYKNLNRYSEYRYSQYIDDVIHEIECLILIQKCDFSIVKSDYFSRLSLKRKGATLIGMLFPKPFDYMKRFRYRYWV
jgi:glycosyltransferase involved in cell wall biosynthesis